MSIDLLLLKELFLAASDLAPADRAAFIAEHCKDDGSSTSNRVRVQQLSLVPSRYRGALGG